MSSTETGGPLTASPPVPSGSLVRRRVFWCDVALCTLGVALGLWYFPLQLLGTDLSRLPGDEIDGRLNNYLLEHGHRYLTGDDPSFWNLPTFYPTPRVTAYSDNHIGTLPIYSCFRTAGYDRETSYQLWWLAILAGNSVLGYAALRGFGLTPLGATLGAAVFAFGMPIQTQIGHLQVFPRFGVPLAFYWCYRFVVTGRTRYYLGTGLAVVWQLFATIYVGYFLVLALVGFFAAGAVLNRREFVANVLRAGWKTWAVRVAILGLCLAPVYRLSQPYREVARVDMYELAIKDVRAHLPKASVWVAPARNSTVWGDQADRFPNTQAYHFPGALAVLGLVAALWPARRPVAAALRTVGLAASVSAVATVLLVLNVGPESPYFSLAELPGVAAVRAVERIVVVTLFPLGVAAGVLVSRLELGVRPRALGWALAVPLVGFGLVEQHMEPNVQYTMNKAAVQDRVARLAERIRAVDPEVRCAVLLVPYDWRNPFPFVVAQLDVMMATQSLGAATPNGYSGYLPPRWIAFQTEEEVGQWIVEADALYGHLRPGLNRRYRDNRFRHFVVLESTSSSGFVIQPQLMTSMESALRPEDCRSTLEVLDPVGGLQVTEQFPLRVRVTNESRVTWRALGSLKLHDPTNDPARILFRIFAAYRWTTPDGAVVGCYSFDDRPRSYLPYDLDIASSQELVLKVDTPSQPGQYVLEVSLGQEGNDWFHHLTSRPTVKIPIDVCPR